MPALGHSRRFRGVGCESALPPRTDIVSYADHVGKEPTGEVVKVLVDIKEAAK